MVAALSTATQLVPCRSAERGTRVRWFGGQSGGCRLGFMPCHGSARVWNSDPYSGLSAEPGQQAGEAAEERREDRDARAEASVRRNLELEQLVERFSFRESGLEHWIAWLWQSLDAVTDTCTCALEGGEGGQTSDAVKLSSCLGKFRGGSGECGGFVVVLAGGQAVVQAAEEAAEEVALGGCVPVAVGFAPVVVGAGAG